MPRRADVQLYARILSKLLGFVPASKHRAGGQNKNGVPPGTPFLLRHRGEGSLCYTGFQVSPVRHGDIAGLGAENHQDDQQHRDSPSYQHQRVAIVTAMMESYACLDRCVE